MKGTKNKIKDEALALFNAQGLERVTTRQVAKSMGISPGNLNYHFPTRESLVEALYFDLVAKMDVEMAKLELPQHPIEQALAGAHTSCRVFYGYRFILRDFYTIMRAFPKIKAHYQELQQQREQQFLAMFGFWVQGGWMREEEFPDEYQRLYQRMNILGDNWINAQELIYGQIEDPVDYYTTLLLEVVYPYLTAKGKEIFLQSTQKAAPR